MAPRASLVAPLALLLALPLTLGFSLFGGPTIDGDLLSWDGDGDTFNPKKAFKDGDKYTRVNLVNWKMDASANLSLPATVKLLSLVNCKLAYVPDEVRALANLEQLNLAHNQITSADGAFASSGTIQILNFTSNLVANYSLAMPALSTLDLSSNKLMTFPSPIFKSPLTTFRISDNGFQLASVSSEQFDFFAGLGDFQADFAAITSCKTGELVNLKGNKICRVEDEVPVNPTVAPSKNGTSKSDSSSSAAGAAIGATTVGITPAATVGVVVNPTAAGGHSDSTYILSGMIALLLAVVVGVGVFAVVTRRQTLRLRGKLHEDTPLFFDSEKRNTYQKELDAGDKLFPSNDQVLVTWRVDYDSVKLVKKIAKGAFGEVWVGRYRGTKVAVKKLLETQGSFEASEDFVREIKLMAWLQHPKIVEFVGVAWTKLVDMLAVIEYMDSGDLRSLLDADRTMKWEDRKLKYALDTIDAIVYLHSLSPVIIHRDLKSRNILVDSKKGAKLGDFGISAAKRDREMTTGVGTTRWLAPELARGEILYTEAVDIYSFGVILAELDTNELPFFDARVPTTGEKLSDFAILQGVSKGELSVSFSPSCPPKLLELARCCVSLDPKARPSAAEVAYQLRQRDLLLA